KYIMRILSYVFLTLMSMGLLGLIAGLAGVIYLISALGQDLPDYSQLKDYSPPVVTRLYAGDGHLMEEYATERRVFVPIDAIPDRVVHAFLSAVDQNFCTHNGVNHVATTRAMISNIKNLGSCRRPEGCSTITQQVAKNSLLTNDVSYKRN